MEFRGSSVNKVSAMAVMVLVMNVPFIWLYTTFAGDVLGQGPAIVTFPTRSFAGGDGSLGSPFQISDVVQLQNISANLSANYVLKNDIDATETKGWDSGKGFEPIGDISNVFKGSLDGGGYRITNLWIDRAEDYIGLFSSIRGGWVHHLSLTGVEIRGANSVGTLSARVTTSRIENVSVQGKLVGEGSLYGGLIGTVEDRGTTITNCSADVLMEGSTGGYAYQLGGLLGMNQGTVWNCRSAGDIKRTSTNYGSYQLNSVGGLIGLNSGTVSGCHSTGSVISEGPAKVFLLRIGGLIGENYGEVTGSSARSKSAIEFNTITLSNCFRAWYIGGLNGFNSGNVLGCYSETVIDIGAFLGSSYNPPMSRIGGLSGECSSAGEVSDCYWSGQIKIAHSTPPPAGVYMEAIGGLVGFNDRSISNCRSLGDLALAGDYQKVGGLVGWNGGSLSRSHSTNPNFRVNGKAYVSDVGGLAGYHEGRDIMDCSFSANMELSVASAPSGKVRNIGGLIGNDQLRSVDNCSTKGKISVTDVPNVEQVGGLIGYCNEGSITRCSSGSTIEIKGCTGSAYSVGGLLGHRSGSSYDSRVEDCQSTGSMTIKGSGHFYRVGGLVGSSGGMVSDCYRSGTLEIEAEAISTPVEFVGALIGSNEKSISKCSTVGTITFDFVGGSSANNKVVGMGGLIGWNQVGGYVSSSSSTVAISPKRKGLDDYSIEGLGGLIGNNEGSLDSCYSTGSLSINESLTASNVGGLVGHNIGSIMNCYAQRTLYYDQVPTGKGKAVGGLIGNNSLGSITDCYTVFSSMGASVIEIGGFAGKNLGIIGSSFFDKDVFKGNGVASGNSSGVSANTTVLMKKGKTYLSAGWDNEEKWGIIEDRTYPWLLAMYHAPMIDIDRPLETLEDVELSILYLVMISSYPSINQLSSVICRKNADWLSHQPGTRSIVGIPDNEDVGTYWLNLTVTDLAGSGDRSTFVNQTIDVRNVNDPPQIITEDEWEVVEDEPYSRYYYAVDQDPLQTEMSWAMSTDAKWLFFEGNHLHGAPLNYDIGEYWVNVSVRDLEGGVDFSNFTVTVQSANDPPEITLEPVAVAFEDELYRMDLTAIDVDEDDRLTWTLVKAPSWLLLSRTYVSGTPGNEDVGTGWVELMVKDVEGESDTLGFILVVKNTNDAPVWTELPGDLVITAGDLMFANALAIDIDEGDRVGYNVSSEPPSNISVHPMAGIIEWGDSAPGNYTVTVTADDGRSQISHIFNVTVKERPDDGGPILPRDNAPMLAEVPDQEVRAGETLTIQLTAVDEDGDPVDFDLVSGPHGMTITHKGTVSWTPKTEAIGMHRVNVSATDGNRSAYVEFEVIVRSSPDPDDNGTSSEEGVNTGLLAAVGVLLLVCMVLIAIVIVMFLARRKRSGPEGLRSPVMAQEGPVVEE